MGHGREPAAEAPPGEEAGGGEGKGICTQKRPVSLFLKSATQSAACLPGPVDSEKGTGLGWPWSRGGRKPPSSGFLRVAALGLRSLSLRKRRSQRHDQNRTSRQRRSFWKFWLRTGGFAAGPSHEVDAPQSFRLGNLGCLSNFPKARPTSHGKCSDKHLGSLLGSPGRLTLQQNSWGSAPMGTKCLQIVEERPECTPFSLASASTSGE